MRTAQKNNNIVRLFFLLMLLIFLPAFGQVYNVDNMDVKIKLSNERFDSTYRKAKELLSNIKTKIDSITKDTPYESDFKRVYNVDHLNGERVEWVFNYDLEYNKWTKHIDTVFNRVTKYYTYWK